MMAKPMRFCTFHVGDLYLGVDLLRVQEVNRQLELTPVPLAVRMVRGLINLRGQIVTAFDLRERLGLPPCAATAIPMMVVLRTDHGVISFLVDSVGDVVEADADECEAPPATLDETVRGFVKSVCKQPGRLLLIVDPGRVFDSGTVAA